MAYFCDEFALKNISKMKFEPKSQLIYRHKVRIQSC